MLNALHPKYIDAAYLLHKQLGQIPHVFIGGLAVAVYGFERATKDLDLMVEGLEAFQGTPLGTLEGLTFPVGDATVDVLLPPRFPEVLSPLVYHPVEIDGLPFIALDGLVLTKLIAGRSKDLTDLAELYKVQGAEQFAAIRRWLQAKVHDDDVLGDFDVAVLTAQAELRGQRIKPRQNPFGQFRTSLKETT